MLLASEQTKALMLLLMLVPVDEDTAVMCTALVNGQPQRQNMEMMCHSNNHGTGPSDVHAPLRACTGRTWAPTTMYLNRATLIYMVPSNATSPTALAQQWQLQLINGPLAGWQLYTPTPPPSWTFGHAIWRPPKQQQLLCYYPAVIASSWQGMSSSLYDTKAAMAAF
jgi:hypothetical protein